LAQLLEALSIDELQLVLGAISRRCDPVFRLPPELVLYIFSYLPLIDAWRLQAVCRRWREVLGTRTFLRASIGRWDHVDDPGDAARVPAPEDSIESRLRHMQAVRTGRPFTYALFKEEHIVHTRFHWRAVNLCTTTLADRKIAYVRQRSQSHEVVVRDLVSGECSMHCGSAREQILTIVLTSAVLGFVGFNGALYVWHLDGSKEMARVTLPSSNVYCLAGHGETIAALFLAEGGPLMSVAVYNAKLGTLKAFDHPSQHTQEDCGAQPLTARTLLVNEVMGIIDVFSSDSYVAGKQHCHVHVGHLRFRLESLPSNKAVLSSVLQIHRDAVKPFSRVGKVFCMVGKIKSIGTHGLFRLSLLFVFPCITGGPGSRLYDGEDQDGDSPWFHQSSGQLFLGHHEHMDPLGDWIFHERFVLRWKDVLVRAKKVPIVRDNVMPANYEFHPTPSTDWTQRLTPRTLTTHSVLWWDVATDHSLTDSYDYCTEYPTALLNDSYLVHFEPFKEELAPHGFIVVLCFDESVGLDGSVPTGLWGVDLAETSDLRSSVTCRRSGNTNFCIRQRSAKGDIGLDSRCTDELAKG
jgi:hypothetical protein